MTCRRCKRKYHDWQTLEEARGLNLCVGCETGLTFFHQLTDPLCGIIVEICEGVGDVTPPTTGKMSKDPLT